ncbi:lariat debranching enzyme [Copidosoma floridanum]|uniref:lariat debranching enzyme n=1 Tax=Copidosoma floridanum TaxID=29053 RepID=UPI0006C9A83A|nr:lariat debranching enzyme [Copidosoma floridanum]
MRIAVEGCAHGELETIYNAIAEAEKVDGKKVDLLLCCGDFQATRNWSDLRCMAVPDKYKNMGTFYKYYTGENVAPCLTIFIGGNHEASNYLQELPYGGWVAPNIYYLGYAGVVSVAGIRIAGLSGIYKTHDFMKGHYEFPPYNKNSIRSAYHIRNLEVYRLKQLSGKIDICMSHDWPRGVTKYGNVNALLRKKPFFKDDIESDRLGSSPAMELLRCHYPSHWFAAHLHCKFTACVTNDDNTKSTNFLALDKCLPKRQFLQIIEVEHDESLPIKLSYDLEWLTILFLTNDLLSVKNGICYMPGPINNGKWVFTPSEEEKQTIFNKLKCDLVIPLNFKETVRAYSPQTPTKHAGQPSIVLNDQTSEFCNKLSISDPLALLKRSSIGTSTNSSSNIHNESFSSRNTSFSPNSSKHTDSFTDLSCSTEDSFIIDTTPTDITPIFEKKIMTPLKLPAARNESNTSLSSINSEDNSQEIQNLSNSSKSPRTLNEMLHDEPDNGKNEIKKFKRRNQSIYADDCVT